MNNDEENDILEYIEDIEKMFIEDEDEDLLNFADNFDDDKMYIDDENDDLLNFVEDFDDDLDAANYGEDDENNEKEEKVRYDDGERENAELECGNKEKEDHKSAEENTWSFPERNANNEEIKIMFAETMAVMILVLFRNHIYKFAGKLWLQDGTGSIGDRATGVIAQYVMIWWCRKFGGKLKE